jgi:hypothetical protein
VVTSGSPHNVQFFTNGGVTPRTPARHVTIYYSNRLSSALFACAGYSVHDRYQWVNAPDTLFAGWCDSALGPSVGIQCDKDGGFDYRITKAGRALYRAPGWAFWPFYHQGESPKLPEFLVSQKLVSEQYATALRALGQPY